MSTDLDLGPISERFARTYQLGPKDGEAIVSLLASCDIRTIRENEVLFTEREEGDAAFFLLQGRIGVSKRDVRGNAMHVSTLEAPTLLGHMSLVDGSPRSATCTALGPCVVAAIHRSRFRSLIGSEGPRGSALRRLLIAAMSEQLAGANSRILTIIDPPADFPDDDETTEHGIHEASQVLEGWKGP